MLTTSLKCGELIWTDFLQNLGPIGMYNSQDNRQCNDIGPYHIVVIGLRKLKNWFTRPFLTGRYTGAGHTPEVSTPQQSVILPTLSVNLNNWAH